MPISVAVVFFIIICRINSKATADYAATAEKNFGYERSKVDHDSLMTSAPTTYTRNGRFLTSLPLFFIFFTSPVFANDVTSYNRVKAQRFKPETTAGLRAYYQALDYSWKGIDQGVPPFILETVPADINHSVSTKAKKQTFFMGLLPMVLLANREIELERAEVLEILDRKQAIELEGEDRRRLTEIANRYGLSDRQLVDHRARTRLLNRVDTIPPALVLAQAANESAWGTSRFAQLGNNIFGEWTYKPGAGIVPEDRPDGEIYEVRKFSSIYDSIRSYMNNLNRNGAYRTLREIRATLRNTGEEVTGIELAKGLANYSQRGEEYIDEIQAMIRQNGITLIDSAFLRKPRKELLSSTDTSGGGLFSTRNRAVGHRTSDSTTQN